VKLPALPQLSQLRASAVRAALGPGWRDVKSVDVSVLSEDGGLPFAGRVDLALMRRGRGVHLGVVCPQCRQPRGVLRLDGEGRLLCQFACFGRLTRQQRLKTTSEWSLGGRELDALIRLLHKPALTGVALVRAEAMVERLERDGLALVAAFAPTMAALQAAPDRDLKAHEPAENPCDDACKPRIRA
jgi:hypothetical protein